MSSLCFNVDILEQFIRGRFRAGFSKLNRSKDNLFCQVILLVKFALNSEAI